MAGTGRSALCGNGGARRVHRSRLRGDVRVRGESAFDRQSSGRRNAAHDLHPPADVVAEIGSRQPERSRVLVIESVLARRVLAAHNAAAERDHFRFRLRLPRGLRLSRERNAQSAQNAEADHLRHLRAPWAHYILPTKPLITVGIGRPASKLATSDASAGATSVTSTNGRT